MRESGFGLGVLMLLVVAYLTYVSVVSLISCGLHTKKVGYEGLMFHLFGRKGYLLISFFMVVQAFGAMCSYLIIIGDMNLYRHNIYVVYIYQHI